MALPADTVWRIRSGGSDTLCAGGFSDANKGATGVDHSQQNAANKAFGATLSAVGTTALTDSAAGFTNTMLGNLIRITGQGVYCIVGFTSTSIVTVDRALGTFGTTAGYEGGANATIATPSAIAVSGNTVSIQAGITLTITAAIVFFSGGTLVGETGTRPLITTTTNSTNLFNVSGLTGCVFKHLSFSNTAGTRARGFTPPSSTATSLKWIDCTFDGFTTAIEGDNQVNFHISGAILVGCEIKNCSSAAIKIAQTVVLEDCNIHDNPGDGLQLPSGSRSGSWAAINTVFANNGGKGINDIGANVSGALWILAGNTVRNNTGIGVDIESSAARIIHVNNVYWGNGTNDVKFAASQTDIATGYNAYGTAGQSGVGVGTGDVTLSADPGVSSTDSTLNSTAGGGVLAKNVGAFPLNGGATSTGRDIGAIPTGGGAAAGGGVLGGMNQRGGFVN